MNILEYADVIDRQLVIHYYPNQNGRFSAAFEYGEVSEGSCLSGTYGNGKTPVAAINDYTRLIRGRKLVFNAYRDSRQELAVPVYVELLPANYKESAAESIGEYLRERDYIFPENSDIARQAWAAATKAMEEKLNSVGVAGGLGIANISSMPLCRRCHCLYACVRANDRQLSCDCFIEIPAQQHTC